MSRRLFRFFREPLDAISIRSPRRNSKCLARRINDADEPKIIAALEPRIMQLLALHSSFVFEDSSLIDVEPLSHFLSPGQLSVHRGPFGENFRLQAASEPAR